MPRVFIHAGFHKTGTTSFQRFLGEHRGWLYDRGIYVPHTGQAPGGAHHALARSIAGLSGPANLEVLPANLAAELGNEAGKHDILISSETLSAMLRAPMLRERLFGFFRGLGYAPTVILYLRHLPGAINSAYSQVTKAFDLAVSFETFVAMQLESEHPRAVFLRALKSDPAIATVIRPYDERVRRAGIIPSLLGDLGVGSPDLPLPRMNESPGPVTIHLARFIASLAMREGRPFTPGQRSRCGQAIQSLAGTEPVSYCGLTDGIVRRIETENSILRDELATDLWGKPWAESFPGEIGRRYQANDTSIMPPPAPEEDRLRRLEDELRGEWERIRSDASIAVQPAWPTQIPNAMQALGIDVEALGLHPRP